MVTTREYPIVAPTAMSWVSIWPPFPSISPAVPPIASTANIPVAMAPQMPPSPWTANTSSESSSRVRGRSSTA